MRLAGKIRQLRLQANLSQEELARRLGVGRTTIINYETGYSTPDGEKLAALAEILGVTESYLTGRQMQSCFEPQCIPVISRLSDAGKSPDMGNVIDYIYLPGQLATEYEYFGLKASDDAMNLSRIYKGDILLVRKQDYADNGDIVVFRTEDDKTLVLRYYKNANLITLLPHSTNVNHKPVQMSEEEFSKGIVGRVMQVIISL